MGELKINDFCFYIFVCLKVWVMVYCLEEVVSGCMVILCVCLCVFFVKI